jgi:hypothetical protein
MWLFISLCSKSNASFLFLRKLQPIKDVWYCHWIEQAFSYKTLSLHIVTTTGYAFLLAMNKSLPAVFVNLCTSGGDFANVACSVQLSLVWTDGSQKAPNLERDLSLILLSPLLTCTTHLLTVLTSTVRSLYTFSEHSWMSTDLIYLAWRNSVAHLCFCVRHHFARLLPCCYLSHSNKIYKLLAGRLNLYCHTTSIRL